MPSEEVTALLGEWEGYGVGFVQRHEADEEGAAPHIWIELIRRPDVPMICSECGQGSSLLRSVRFIDHFSS